MELYVYSVRWYCDLYAVDQPGGKMITSSGVIAADNMSDAVDKNGGLAGTGISANYKKRKFVGRKNKKLTQFFKKLPLPLCWFHPQLLDENLCVILL